MSQKFNISEIFSSIQGEGPELGQAVIFIRFSGCNLRCRWGDSICDTAYTSWYPERNPMPLSQILSQVRELKRKHKSLSNKIILTGGEPTIVPNFEMLCTKLKQEGFVLSLETNGNGPIPDCIDLIVCSPKLSDSTPLGTPYERAHERRRRLLVARIDGTDPRVVLKLVVGPSTKLDEILQIVSERKFPKERVYLMPLGTNTEELDKNLKVIAKLNQSLGYKISDREHIRRWGNRRGY